MYTSFRAKFALLHGVSCLIFLKFPCFVQLLHGRANFGCRKLRATKTPCKHPAQPLYFANKKNKLSSTKFFCDFISYGISWFFKKTKINGLDSIDYKISLVIESNPIHSFLFIEKWNIHMQQWQSQIAVQTSKFVYLYKIVDSQTM